MNFHKNNKHILIILLVLIAIALIGKSMTPKPLDTPIVEEIPMATTTEPVEEAPMTQSNGIITFAVPKDFGLALTVDQIMNKHYIPSCDNTFDYCLYYNGTKYDGTNFESAGLRIKNRTDLKTVATCLNTSPDSFPGLKSQVVASTTSYMVASFPGIGDAGAGHYASGEFFRLAYDGTCHEFETRVGATQFLNFPAGTKREFTGDDSIALRKELRDIITNSTLRGGEKLSF